MKEGENLFPDLASSLLHPWGDLKEVVGKVEEMMKGGQSGELGPAPS